MQVGSLSPSLITTSSPPFRNRHIIDESWVVTRCFTMHLMPDLAAVSHHDVVGRDSQFTPF
jgi:hypothetical protein